MSVFPPLVRGVHRRLALPPPTARSSLAVWRELADADEDLAWALFLVTRRVRAVADGSAPARWKRADDVRAAAAGAPEIAADLLLLGARQLSLAGERRGRVAGACNRLAAWAAEQGFGEVAVQLAEAAVALQPENSRRTYEAGRLNRMFGNLDSAEVLYSRAICLARPGKFWWVYVRAHLGMGHVCISRGRLDRAAVHYTTAARRARDKSGEKWLAAMIEHDLMVLAFESKEYERAHEHARRALSWMPRHNEQLPLLVHDYAFLLIHDNAPEIAIRLLEPLIEKRLPSSRMVLIWSTFAWSAAALGDAERYRIAGREVRSLAPRFGTHAAHAYVHLGFGACRLGLWSDAERCAKEAAEIARQRGETSVMVESEALLAAAAHRTLANEAPMRLRLEEVEQLAAELDRRLVGWRGPTWKRKRQASRSRLGRV